MITLITGTPGSGKTLRAVYLISKAVDEGRPVYTDIDGITLPEVLPVPLDHDWRDTPEGSLVVYDEVQRRWPSTGRPGHADDEDIRALETHRHTGHDIIVITQHPTLVHHHVRKLVGEHIHVRRSSNAHAVSLFTAPEVFDPKDSQELRNTDKELWRYPKKLFTAYKSATAHTHKFKIPTKIKLLGSFLLLLVVALIYAFATWDSPWSDDSDSQTSAPPRAESEARPAAVPLSTPDPQRSHSWGGHLPFDLLDDIPPSDASRSAWDRLSEHLPGLDDGIYIAGMMSMGDDVKYLYRILSDGVSRLVSPEWLFSAGFVVSYHDHCTHDLTHTLDPESIVRITCEPVRSSNDAQGAQNGDMVTPPPDTESVSYVPFSPPPDDFRSSGAYSPE